MRSPLTASLILVNRSAAPGSDRERGWFWIGAGSGEIIRVLLTEFPIDALSLATLDRSRRQTQGVTIYLSTDGARAVPVSALQSVLERGGWWWRLMLMRWGRRWRGEWRSSFLE